MKTIYLSLIGVVFFISAGLAQTVSVSGADPATNAGSPYTTLRAAFTSINSSTQAGNVIVITIAGTTTETAAAALNQSVGPWTSLTITPVGAASVTANAPIHLIDLIGADNVTINGLNSGGNSLTIDNAHGLNCSTIRFINDASNNTIINCNLLGSTGFGGPGFGVVFFHLGISTGNDNNTITQCNIAASSGGTPLNGILSIGTGGAENSNNTISTNNISDFFNPASVSAGIQVNANSDAWTITNNALYQTATRTITSNNIYHGILVTNGSGYTISNNVIGFAAPNATGTTNMIGLSSGSLGGTFPSAFTAGGVAGTPRYSGITCSFTTGGTVSSIQNNTIGGIAFYTGSSATATSGILCGIQVTSGNANIGTVTGNTIGSASGTSSIYAASTSAGAVIAGIYCSSTNTISIQNNTIGGIDVSGTTVAQATGFKGIDVAGTGTFTVSNNNVGNAIANNIRTGYLLTGANLSNTATMPTAASGGGAIRGIVSSATGATLDISNNIIQGIQVSGNASTYTGISSTGTITTTMNINANQVGNAVTNAVSFAFATGGTVHGINIFPNASATINLNNNSIYGITCPAANSIAGIITSGGSATATLNINNNSFISNVINGPAVSTPMTAITNSAIVSVLNITGNIIRSNSSTTTSGTTGFTGIQNSANVVNAVNINNNQLGNASGGLIAFSAATTGTITGISNISAALTATINITDNSVQGISCLSSGNFIGITNGGSSGVAINITGNQLGTATGDLITYSASMVNGIREIFNSGGTGSCVLTIQNNSIRGIVHTVAGTGFHTYISNTASGLASVNINSNTFINLNVNTTGNVTFIADGGGLSATGTSSCSNNSITTAFNKSGASGNIYIYTSGSNNVNGSAMTETGNNFSNITMSGTGTIFVWQNAAGVDALSGPTRTVTGNTFSNISGGSGAIIIMSLNVGKSTACSSNTISNITGTGLITAISIGTANGAGTHNYLSNTISSLSSTGTGGTVTGISASPGVFATYNINNNAITGLSSTGAGSLVEGIRITGSSLFSVNDNSINNLSSSGTVAPKVRGIIVNNGVVAVSVLRNKIINLEVSSAITTTEPSIIGIEFSVDDGNSIIANNFIADLRAPAISSADAIQGMRFDNSIAGLNGFEVYYNSIYINASSGGTNFGTTGFYHTATFDPFVGAVYLVDNIIVNTSTPNGTGVTTAYRRSNPDLQNYITGSDNNLFYAGTPTPNRLIFYDGTNADQTLAAYKTRVSPAIDANSISLMPIFVSATDLHLTDANCGIDGKGTPVSVTTDIDGTTRNATTPDIGADEFTATYGPVLAGFAGTAVCDFKTVSPSGTTYATSVCDLIARVVPSGASPVAGKINVCVTRDASQLSFNGEPYVQRHYDLEPVTSNQTTTSATITLYFDDAEFALYNTNNPAWPKLPTVATGGMGSAFIGNVKVTQFHGTPTGGLPTSTPGNYTGTRVLFASPVLALNGTIWSVTIDIIGFSGFYVHTNNFNAPLPITVNYLTGHKQGSNHLLNWKVTCNSTPRATMTLERSSDARNYTGINTITADAARCNQPFDYTDANPLTGMNYYRLKIVDADGKVTYSTTVALLNAVKGFDIISIAPNPVVTNNLKLNIASAQSSKMELVIFDMQGRLVNRQSISVIAGYNSLPVNVANLSPGTYTIQAMIAADKSKIIPFVKQ